MREKNQSSTLQVPERTPFCNATSSYVALCSHPLPPSERHLPFRSMQKDSSHPMASSVTMHTRWFFPSVFLCAYVADTGCKSDPILTSNAIGVLLPPIQLIFTPEIATSRRAFVHYRALSGEVHAAMSTVQRPSQNQYHSILLPNRFNIQCPHNVHGLRNCKLELSELI